jgi:hypothetical protein
VAGVGAGLRAEDSLPVCGFFLEQAKLSNSMAAAERVSLSFLAMDLFEVKV